MIPDFAILEVIDPETGAPLALDQPEARGELVFTHIDRECVPLVRFRTRGQVVIRAEPCPCGQTGVRIRCIGRTDDMLILLGVNVWPSAIKDVIMSMKPRTTREVQVLLSQPGPRVDPPLQVRVEYGPGEEHLSALKREVEETLRDRLIFSAQAELVPAGTLPRFELKARLVRRLYEEDRREGLGPILSIQPRHQGTPTNSNRPPPLARTPQPSGCYGLELLVRSGSRRVPRPYSGSVMGDYASLNFVSLRRC